VGGGLGGGGVGEGGGGGGDGEGRGRRLVHPAAGSWGRRPISTGNVKAYHWRVGHSRALTSSSRILRGARTNSDRQHYRFPISNHLEETKLRRRKDIPGRVAARDMGNKESVGPRHWKKVKLSE